MVEITDRVIVELEARLDRYDARIRNAERHFERSMRGIRGSAQATEARVASAFRNIAGSIGVTIGAAGVVAGARAFLQYADAAKNLEAQLRLATRESGSFARAQDDVRRIARETRSGLEETAQLYATFQRNSRELGITQEQAARATETVSKSFLISGASAAEAAGGLRQFLQGIQSGVLRGEELNSVLENAPRLARLLADSLNITVGQLRAMGQEGALAGDKLIRALTDRRFTDQIDEEFRQLPVTFDQAMTLVNNAAIETFGAFDRGGRFSEAIANFVLQGTDGMEDIASAAEQMGIDVRAAIEGLATAFDPMWDAGTAMFGDLSGQAINFRNIIADIAGALDSLAGLANRAEAGARRGAVTGISTLAGPFSPWVRPILERNLPGTRPFRTDARERALSDFDRSQRRGQDDAATRRMGGQVRNGRAVIDTEFQRFLNEPDRFDIFGNPRVRTRARPSGTGGSGSGSRRRRGGGESAETRARREAAEAQRFENELAQLNEDLLSARQSSVAAAEAVAALEIQEIEAVRDRQNAAYQASVEQTRGDKALAQTRADQLVELNNQVAEERIRSIRLREERRLFDEREETLRQQLELDRTDLEVAADTARLQGQLAETREGQREAALRELELSTEMERIQLRSIIEAADRLAALEALDQATRAEVEAAQSAAAIARRRLDALPGREAAERALINRANEGPRERYLRELRNSAASVNDQLEQIQVDGIRDLRDEAASAAREMLGLSGAIGNVAERLIALALDRGILELLGALGGVGGGKGKGGGGFDFITSAFNVVRSFGGFKAVGGPVRAGVPYVVGERGAELFVPQQSGTIVPQGRAAMPAPVGTPQKVTILVQSTGDFEAKVVSISGTVAVDVVRSAAPQIIAGAKAETLREAMRPRLNRG